MNSIPVGLRKEMIQRLVDEFKPETIYLFGSNAWGSPEAGSDIDLLGAQISLEAELNHCHKCIQIAKAVGE